jgi:SAM-dependent methyltransferase
MSYPLNQLYRMKATFSHYPKIKEDYDALTKYAKSNMKYLQSIGRNYDFAVLMNFPGVDFKDKIVCELGGRNGHFASYLTKYAKQVYVSDYFKDWDTGKPGGLPDLATATEQWKSISPNPERLICEAQDITKLTYDDNMFDYVICTSVIEHLYPQSKGFGDTIGIKEIVRICKPGGTILLSTDMSKTGDLEPTRWVSGTFWYTEKELYERVINPSGCELIGPVDFSFENVDNDAMHAEPKSSKGLCSSCILALRKN